MASSLATEYLGSRLKIVSYDHDPDGTSATIVSPDGGTTPRVWDMRDFERFGLIAMASTLTGNGITKVEIIASASDDMSSPVVVKDSGTVAADAVGDQVFLELHQSELGQLSGDNDLAAGAGLRYVAGRITMHNSADEAVVTYIGVPVNPQSGLTPATTIA